MKKPLAWVVITLLVASIVGTMWWLRPRRVQKLAQIQAIHVQLRDYDAGFIGQHSTDHDTLFVLDASKFARGDLERLKNSESNVVLAQLDIALAETALNAVIDAGFDGVVLDQVGAYQRVPLSPDSARDRVESIGRVGAVARKRNRAFLVIPLNSACLADRMTFPSADDTELKTMSRLYFGSIDAILVDSVFFPTPKLEDLKCLEAFPGQAKRIFGIEHVRDPIEQGRAQAEFSSHQIVGQVILSNSPTPR